MKRFAPWNPPYRHHDRRTKKMLEVALNIAIKVIMKNHVYSSDGMMIKQSNGGPIGLDLTGHSSGELVADGSMDDDHIVIPVHKIEEKDQFRLFVQYRGKCTEQYARVLHNLQAPCKFIMTLRKLKTVLPPLKPHVEWSMRSGVIHQITCLRCQVPYFGQTDRHLVTHFKEHRDMSSLPLAMHFADCNLMMEEEDVVILA